MVALGQYYDETYGWVTIYEQAEDIPANAQGYYGVVYPSATLSRIGSKEVYVANSPLTLAGIISLVVGAAVVVVVSLAVAHVLAAVVTVIKAGQANVVDETADGSKIVRADDGSVTLFHPDGTYENISEPTTSGTTNIIWAGVAGVAILAGVYAGVKYVIPAIKKSGEEGEVLARKALPKAKGSYEALKKRFEKKKTETTEPS